ncbi:MAG: lipid-A-disaccharide synthase [Candidatus Fervidibacter sp.]|uniref:lipid-A-disaccharide synthase n=1 Tax=Candidatus Fervidibacter sp. TaxID=3100871 RepID=UPI00404BA300
MVRVFFSVGDASGDIYAAVLAREIKRLCPDWHIEGIGGSEMLKAGVKLLRYTTPFSAFGFWSSIQTSIRFWLSTSWRVSSYLSSSPPDLFVPVDLGAFNRRLLLPLANEGVKVFYFVPPSFWGVRPERLRKYAHPNIVFAPIYNWQKEKLVQAGANVIEFGHPLTDILEPYRTVTKSDARSRLSLPDDRIIVGLFPGSRLTTVKENLPLLLQTGQHLTRKFPKIHFAIGLPEGWLIDWVQAPLKRWGKNLSLSAHFGQSRFLLKACDVAILVAGTITLEAACLGAPSVMVFQMGPLNRLQVHWLRLKGVNVLSLGPFALPNRLIGKVVVPEFVGWAANPSRIAGAVAQLLIDPTHRSEIQQELLKVREKLGEQGAASRIASFLKQWLKC